LLGFYVVAAFLYPILPTLSTHALALFDRKPGGFDELLGQLPAKVLPYQPLLTRIDPKQIDAMTEASKEDLKPAPAQVGAASAAIAPAKVGAASGAIAPAKQAGGAIAAEAAPTKTAGLIGIEDFARLDLRIGTVLECAAVEGSDKLLRFLLDAGELGQRQIFSGIRAGYPDPAALVGRQVVFIANLAPRKMRFGISEGMILSAGGDDGLFLLDVDPGAVAGMTVK
ncbi:MAG: methionine--tRNA ligase subunit beta, partial [Arenimonas sp.]